MFINTFKKFNNFEYLSSLIFLLFLKISIAFLISQINFYKLKNIYISYELYNKLTSAYFTMISEKTKNQIRFLFLHHDKEYAVFLMILWIISRIGLDDLLLISLYFIYLNHKRFLKFKFFNVWTILTILKIISYDQ